MLKIEKAKTVKGWMNDHELRWLAAQASKAGSIIEVGCAYGRSTRVIIDNKPSGFLYAVDTWNGSPSELKTNHSGFRTLGGDGAFFAFCSNLRTPIRAGQIIPFRMRSSNAAALFTSMKLQVDFIFIDACHDYEAVKSDIINFLPLLRTDGILAGHDYKDSNWPGVTKAVDELIPNALRPLPHIWVYAA